MIQQHLRRPTAMPYGTHFHVFRQGMRPEWEDPAFAEGCQLEIKSQKNTTSKYWEDMILAMMGEQFETADFVYGMVMKLKPQFDKISVWLKDSSATDAIALTKKKVAEILAIKEDEIEFMIFKEQKNKPAPVKKNFVKGKKPTDDGPIKGQEATEPKTEEKPATE